MGKYVQLNDVLDETTPTVMRMRIDYAFGTDGTNFWQNFFFCNTVCDTVHENKNHKNDKVIYFFTEYQLGYLLDWWDNMMRTSDYNTQLKLEYSKQVLFNTNQARKKYNEIFACHIMDTPGYHKYNEIVLENVGFGEQKSRYFSPGRSKYVDFFEGQFRGEPPDSSKKLGDDEYKNKIKLVLRAKDKIAKEFGGPIYKKWLHYLAPKRNITLPSEAEYCVDINPDCPLIIKINSSTLPPDTSPPAI